MANRLNFTKAAIAGLLPPEAGARETYHDAKVTGLQLRVTSNGVRTFSLFRRVKGGGPERVTIGTFPDTTVEQARKRAGQLNSRIEAGTNPAALKRADRAEITFAELFDEYVERHGKPRKRTWKEDKAKYRQYLAKPLGSRKLSAIGRAEIASVHSAVTKESKPVTANRVLALVSSVFGWAVSAGLWESNPAKGIRRNAERSRDRFLQANELPRFYASLSEETNDTIRDYFLMSLLTGARRANVLAMRWSEIDFARGEWRIARTKNGEPQTIPLAPEAVSILNDRKHGPKAAHVFPGEGVTGHLVEPKAGWQRIFDRDELKQIIRTIEDTGGQFKIRDFEHLADAVIRARQEAKRLKLDVSHARIQNVRIHDLRRTLGSWQARTGASLAIIGKSLNHKSVQTTAIYSRLDTDPVRESMERATSAILSAAGVKPSAGVEQIKRVRRTR